ncbi:MAG: hypothetical protein Ct9H300mP8_00080 [Gammaproteobacteria bacterium]|nr:MAG: hypothetical protein Ct9H300mP8_00080 [Gammaproteobacteria bacterium]
MAIVIVGGGHAAGQAAASIRQGGFDAELILIGGETLHIPYQRPPLSKQYLAGEQPLDKVLLRPKKFYGIAQSTCERELQSKTLIARSVRFLQ